MNQKYSVNSWENRYVAPYHLETSAMHAFTMPWELNMPHTVTGNTPGEVCVFFFFLNVLLFIKSASTHSKGFSNLLHVSSFKVVNQHIEWPRQPSLNLCQCCWILTESPPSCTPVGRALLIRRTFTQCKQRTGNGRKEELIMHPHQEHIAGNQWVCKHIRLFKFPYFIHQAVAVHAASLKGFLNVYSQQPTKIDCNGFKTRLVIWYFPKVLA